MLVAAPAKINLTLQVGRPRADGLHPLQSVVAFAHVGEWVEVKASSRLSLTVRGPCAGQLSRGAPNLVVRAADALAHAGGFNASGQLRLHKVMPVASGIGGGSSDAAATLKALNVHWGLKLSEAQLVEVARSLGSDVPVCVGARPAYMTDTGQTFSDMKLPEFDVVLVNPSLPMPTPDVYRRFDAMNLGGGFTEASAPEWPTREAALAGMAAAGNDLEAPAQAIMPVLKVMSAYLRADPRVLYAALSGSGATMFAIVNDPADAEALRDRIVVDHPEWWVRAARLGG